jgi:diguanylate cyclase (GGDEF)-like protein
MTNLRTRTRIILLVILAALPALLLIAVRTAERRAAAETQAKNEIQRLAKLAAMQQWQVVEGARQMLTASSQVLPLLKASPKQCSEYFGGLLRKNSQTYHSMGLFRPDGRLFCNAVTWHDSVYAGDRLYFRLAKETGRFSIGEYQVGRLTGKAGINFGYPVTDARGEVTAVTFAGLDLDSIGRMAEATPLPPGGILSVVDVKGTILARKPAIDGRVGEKLWNPQVIEVVLAVKEGAFEARDSDGVGWLFAHEVVTQNPDGAYPLRVIVSVPLDQVFAAANKAFFRDLAGIIVATLFLLIGAWYGAGLFVLQKIEALLHVAERMRSGDLNARSGIRYGKEELSQLAKAFDDMARALQRREQALHEQAVTDPLTGLYNRRYFAEHLPRELLRATRGGTAVSVILLDLDYFKRVNDSLGHDAGDMVLMEIGSLLKRNVRGSDIACRYGGEEFAFVLPQTGLEAAMRRAEEIRTAVRGLDLHYLGRPIGRITVSLGLALYPDDADDTDSLIRAADEALYHAKAAGRDRVVVRSARKAD